MSTPNNPAPIKQRQEEASPVDPKRVRAFAVFFKRYMSISTLVVASLPIPVTALGLIPTFSAQTKLLSIYTPLFCFLTLGFIFYSRHQLARIMFPEYFGMKRSEEIQLDPTLSPEDRKRKIEEIEGTMMFKNLGRYFISMLPLLFIAASIVSIFQYNDVLSLNVHEAASQLPPIPDDKTTPAGYGSFKYILENTDLDHIKYSSRLMILYISIFITAEAAFIMMAIKEYLQDLVGLTEMDLIRGPQLH